MILVLIIVGGDYMMKFDVKEFRNPKSNLIVGYVLNINNTMFYLRNDEMQELLSVLTPVAEDFSDNDLE